MLEFGIWQPTLTGPLLCLRPLAEADWEGLHEAADDPEIWVGHPVPDRWRRPIFRQFFDNVLAKRGAMAVIDRSTNALVGSSTFHNHKPAQSEVEIGSTFLARSHWGGLFNGELKSLMLTYAFTKVDWVVFRIGETNVRSQRACEKVGGRLTQRTEMVEGPHGPILHLVYQIAREDFQRSLATEMHKPL